MKPSRVRLDVVCARVFSRRPVIRKIVMCLDFARLKRSRDGVIAVPISFVASACDCGPNVKLSALIAV